MFWHKLKFYIWNPWLIAHHTFDGSVFAHLCGCFCLTKDSVLSQQWAVGINSSLFGLLLFSPESTMLTRMDTGWWFSLCKLILEGCAPTHHGSAVTPHTDTILKTTKRPPSWLISTATAFQVSLEKWPVKGKRNNMNVLKFIPSW